MDVEAVVLVIGVSGHDGGEWAAAAVERQNGALDQDYAHKNGRPLKLAVVASNGYSDNSR